MKRFHSPSTASLCLRAGSMAALAAIAAMATTLGLAPSPAPAQTASVRVPADIGEDLLAKREEQQLKSIEDLDVFYFFRFVDDLKDSGISFRHHVTDDAGRDYKMVHYDHGNGLAVADVDGDGLYDLYFLSQIGPNALFKNLGDGKFRDITESAGVGLGDRISVTASFADFDNDGDEDLFVTTVRMGNVLFENDGKGHFRDVSGQAGVDYSGHSSGAVFFDYDNDGRLDLFLTNVGTYTTDERGHGGYYVGIEAAFSGHLMPERTETSILYHNEGEGRFVDASKATGLVDGSWSGDATFADLNGDLFPDLYVLNMQGDDHYYENEEGKAFVDRTAQTFPKTPWGAMGVQFFDYDNDGRLDLYVTDMHSDMTEYIGPEKEKLKSTESVMREWGDEHLQGGANNIFGNAFYRNLGDGRFEEISDRIGVENYWPWGVSVGDINADGWQDLFVTASMNYQFRYGIDSVLLNDGGRKFVDSEFILGVEPRQGDLVAPWFELDCSGADKAREECKDRQGPLTVMGAVGSRSSVIFDLDGDGDLDIVTSEFNSPPQVLISDLSENTDVHFLEVVLQGSSSNRDGLGATVVVTAGGRTYTQYHNGKSGYLSQSALPLYFGLGDASAVERVDIRWPSGRKQTMTEGLAVNTRVTAVEP